MATLGDLLIRVGVDLTALGELDEKLSSELSKAGTSLTRVGAVMTKLVTAPILGAGAAALTASISFESAFAGVRKTVDATESQFAMLEKGIRDMSKEIPASANDIARVAEAAGQLGIKTPALLGFTRTMIDLGETTNLSADQAATQLARLANITQMPQSEFGRLGSTVVALGNNLATTEAEIVDMALRLAGAGKQVGLTEAQILGFAGALSSVGIEAEMGGSAFSRVMINMAQAVKTGGGELGLFAQVAGMSGAQFQQAFQQDAAGAIIAFVEGLGRISAEGGNVFGVLEQLGFSEIRVRDALLRASGAGDLFRESIALGSQAWQENTALTNEAAQRYATTESQLRILWNRLVEVSRVLGDAMKPALLDVMAALEPTFQGVERLANSFAKASPETQRLVMGVAAAAAAMGPLLFTMGTAISLLPHLVNGFKLLGVGGLAGAAGITAIAAAITAGIAVALNWETVSEQLQAEWRNLGLVSAAVWAGVRGDISEAIALTKVWLAIGADPVQHRNRGAMAFEQEGVEGVDTSILGADDKQWLAWVQAQQQVDDAMAAAQAQAEAMMRQFAGMGDEAQKKLEATKEAISGLGAELAKADAIALAFSGRDPAGPLEAKAKALTAFLQQAYAGEIAVSEQALATYRAQLDALNSQLAQMSAADARREETDALRQKMLAGEAADVPGADTLEGIDPVKLEEMKQAVWDFGQVVSSVMTAAATAFGDGLYQMIAEGRSFGSVLGGIGGAMLSAVGDVLVQLGQASIAAGTAALALKFAIANPFAAIAAGIAAIALGRALQKAGASASRVALGSHGKARGGGASSGASVGSTNVNGNRGFGGGTGGTQAIQVQVVPVTTPSGALVWAGQEGNRRDQRAGKALF